MRCRNCGCENVVGASTCVRCGGKLNPSKKNRWLIPLLSGIAGIAVVIIIAMVAIELTGNDSTVKYAKQIEIANEYLENNDYEAALDAYLKAIEADGTNAEAYEGAARAYKQLGKYDEAQNILLTGYRTTGVNHLQAMYKRYMTLDSDSTEEEVKLADNVSDKVSYDVNSELLLKLLNYTYNDYVTAYGKFSVMKKSGAESVVAFEKFNGNITYQNGDVKTFEASTGVPLKEMRASKMTVNNLSDLIVNFEENMKFDDIKQLFGNSTKIKEKKSGGYFIYCEYNRCAIKIECDKNGTIKKNTAWNEILALVDTNQVDEKNYVSGRIISAQDGKGIKSVKLSFREGRNRRSGSVDAEHETRTDANGKYEIQLEAGTYTVETKVEGFNEEYFELKVDDGQTVINENYTLVPTLAAGTLKIVLEWGATPSDLDSHLDGRTSDGVDLHVDYTNKTCARNGVEYANLDLDDTSSYGPETITLNDANGNYTYSVEDFSNRANSSSTQLGSSGATVKVYLAGQSDPIVFNVPQQTGTVWNVFSIQGGNITNINTVQ